MTKVAINRCFGGFGLSSKAFERLLERRGIEFEKTEPKYKFREDDFEYYTKGHVGEDDHYLSPYNFTDKRDDPDLIAVIEELGVDVAGGWASELAVVEIPDGVEWHIHEYDGNEHVAENHRTWG